MNTTPRPSQNITRKILFIKVLQKQTHRHGNKLIGKWGGGIN